MTEKIKQIGQEFVRVNTATVISNKKMIEVIGQSKNYTRIEDSTHEMILDSKFIDPFFGDSCKRIFYITTLLSKER